jgi:hypothetical protein
MRTVVRLLPLLLLVGCFVNVREVRVESRQAPYAPLQLSTPVKAHVLDGSTIVYEHGVQVTNTALEGRGERFDLLLRPAGQVSSFPLDSVAAFESYRTATKVTPSILASLAGTALGVVGAAALSVAIFGSCPTIYTDSAGTPQLQGEAFSYSIAPLFEMRDVDRISAHADADGVVWIEVRNEALETHYINTMELLHVAHDASQRLLPDEQGRPVLVTSLVSPRAARDGAGRNVVRALTHADGDVFASARERSDAPAAHDYQDFIELQFDLPQPRDSVALVLRLRNSLLNTILFYDVMIGAAGARSVDWIGGTLEDIGHATELGKWYSGRSGVRVYLERAGSFEQVGRIPDAGPIADKDVAVVMSTGGQTSLRVRLEFLADSWRIDQATLATGVERPAARALAPSIVASLAGERDEAAVVRLSEPDDEYLVTLPGHALRVGFDAGSLERGRTHSWLLAAQGYYIEWVRADWVRTASTTETFRPGDAALDAVYARWRAVRDDFEARFFNSRIPVGTP